MHDPAAGISRLSLRDGDAWRRVAPDETIRAVTGAYLLNPDFGDQDGYTTLGLQQIVEGSAPTPLKAVSERAFTGDVAPAVEGRICNTERGGGCLAVE